jgi:hypothetical protein
MQCTGAQFKRLDGLKAMFYAVNRINAADGGRILGYQLFQIAQFWRLVAQSVWHVFTAQLAE